MNNFYNQHKDEIFKKYNTNELIKDINSYKNGKGRLYKTLNHFFEECIFESKGRRTKISPMEVLYDDEKINDIFTYIKSKPNFYKSNDISNLKSYFRNATSWVRKVANFPAREAQDIYFRYHDKNGDILNILDTSAGFGSRMSAVLLNNHNYCGIDPNTTLYKQLQKYAQFLDDNDLTTGCVDLRCCGSEVYQPDLVNKFDISFTSPPYFNLEKYGDDDSESTKNYDNYSIWLKNFATPTIQNTYQYLKVGGIAMINIKNISKKEPLLDDWKDIFDNIDGFEYVETFDMNLASKKQYGMAQDRGDIVPKEPVIVFKKIK